MALSNGFVTTAGTTALDARQMDVVRLMRQAAGNTRTGVVFTPRTDGTLWTTNSNMTITIPDRAAFAVSRGTADGVAVLYNNGAATVQLDPAPSANSRYDVIYVRQNDTEKGDANSLPVFGVAKGTAAASPTIPAVPVGALALGNLLIPANVTGTNASGVVSSATAGFTTFGGAVRYRSTGTLMSDSANLPNGTLQVLDVDGISTQLWASISGGRSQRIDADTFVVIDGSGTKGSNTDLLTLGGTITRYSSSDTAVFPTRSDGTIGPITVGGWYDVTAAVSWTSTGNGERYVSITQNDTEGSPPIATRVGSSSGMAPSNTTGVLSLNVGDYIKLKAWQTSNSTLTYNFRFSARLKRANN
ncbi:hypothetical protein [Curtobacterium sp. MCLR17_034]|uniref:hypothetical protein n=1 Tax=Curtobacterium sp. MCLR17_034 TaxID=2175623 RepID=UPI0011B6D50C|nr:hypothetical protein [Curtobacterium sp. MCLR17_034]